MENQKPKLTKAEIAALDFLIETAREQGGSIAWPAAAAAVVAAAGTMVVAGAVAAQIGAKAKTDALADDLTNEVLNSFRKAAKQDELTLEQLIELRNKVQ